MAVGAELHEVAQQEECEIVKGQLRPGHVHIVMWIPPKYAVSAVIGFIKGKSAIAIAGCRAKSTTSFLCDPIIRTIAFEAVTLIKPSASPGCLTSDYTTAYNRGTSA